MAKQKKAEEVSAPYVSTDPSQLPMFSDYQSSYMLGIKPPPPRPTFKDLSKKALYKSLVEEIATWADMAEEDVQADVEAILRNKSAFYSDAFDLAKEFDHKGYNADSALVSLLDGVSYHYHDALKAATQAWVKGYGVKAMFSIGDSVTFIGRDGDKGGIVAKLYEETAEVGLDLGKKGSVLIAAQENCTLKN